MSELASPHPDHETTTSNADFYRTLDQATPKSPEQRRDPQRPHYQAEVDVERVTLGPKDAEYYNSDRLSGLLNSVRIEESSAPSHDNPNIIKLGFMEAEDTFHEPLVERSFDTTTNRLGFNTVTMDGHTFELGARYVVYPNSVEMAITVQGDYDHPSARALIRAVTAEMGLYALSQYPNALHESDPVVEAYVTKDPALTDFPEYHKADLEALADSANVPDEKPQAA